MKIDIFGIEPVYSELGIIFDCPDTTDLEAATKTITATAEAATADYSSALTLPAPTDARLTVKRIAARLAATIDSMTAGTLYCRVYVDSQVANNRLFDLSWTTTGAKLAAADTHSAAYATIFALLKDGAAHTFYFFFWVDAGNAVLSLVQLREGVGTCSTTNVYPFSITFKGTIHMQKITNLRIGTGTCSIQLSIRPGASAGGRTETQETDGAKVMVLAGEHEIMMSGTVATDLNYLRQFFVNIEEWK